MENKGRIFMTIRETGQVTGLSINYLRSGCRAGAIPCIMNGSKYMINVPMLIEILNQQSEENRRAKA